MLEGFGVFERPVGDGVLALRRRLHRLRERLDRTGRTRDRRRLRRRLVRRVEIGVPEKLHQPARRANHT